MNCKKSYLHVKSKRAIVGPHRHLRIQLIAYELHLFGSNTIQLNEWEALGRRIEDEHFSQKQKGESQLSSEQSSNSDLV
jgi:hypothetical protein